MISSKLDSSDFAQLNSIVPSEVDVRHCIGLNAKEESFKRDTVKQNQLK